MEEDDILLPIYEGVFEAKCHARCRESIIYGPGGHGFTPDPTTSVHQARNQSPRAIRTSPFLSFVLYFNNSDFGVKSYFDYPELQFFGKFGKQCENLSGMFLLDMVS
jgi:hypothetical protein